MTYPFINILIVSFSNVWHRQAPTAKTLRYTAEPAHPENVVGNQSKEDRSGSTQTGQTYVTEHADDKSYTQNCGQRNKPTKQ